MVQLLSCLVQRKGRAERSEENNVQKWSCYLGNNMSITDSIQAAIEKNMYPSNSTTDKFICESRLRDEVWSKFPLHNIPTFEHWDPAGLEIVKDDYLVVLSILIYIGWNVGRFRPVIYKKGINDRSLPFHEGQLYELEGLQQRFIEVQYMFQPHPIKWYHASYVNNIGKDFCLPFTKEPELQGVGSSGEVTKRTIAAGYFLEIRDDGEIAKNLKVSSLLIV